MNSETPTKDLPTVVSAWACRVWGAFTRFLQADMTFRGRALLSAPAVAVMGLSATVNAIVFAGGSALYFPDSGNYVVTAYNIFFDGNVQMNFARTPGYSLFLAPIVGTSGVHAMTAIMAVQHVLVVLVSLAVVKVGDTLDSTRVLGLVAGILSAFSLQLAAYANLPMTEVLYTTLLTWGLYYALRYLRHDSGPNLVLAAVLFSLATVVRPASQYLALVLIAFAMLQFAFPGLRRSDPGGKRAQTRRVVPAIAGAVAAVVIIVSPWMIYNHVKNGYFGLGGNFGLNLYSNTVDFGSFWDENSPAIKDIRRRWEEAEAERRARGEAPETRYTWRNHWPSMAHYTEASGQPMWAADKVFLEAALDAIKAHPWAYIRHVGDNIIRIFIYTEPAHLYLPGVGAAERGRGYRRYALPVTNLEAPRANLSHALSGRFPDTANPIRFHPPSALTSVYGVLAFAYQSVHVYGYHLLAVFAFGMGLAVWRGFRTGGLLWWTLLAYIAYTAFVPMLVATATPRYRLPADPAITILYATFFIFAAEAAWRAVRRLACLVWDRN